MEAVFHTGKESDQHLREFAEKRADFVLRELRDCGAKELKALLHILQEENRTFAQRAGTSYNESNDARAHEDGDGLKTEEQCHEKKGKITGRG